MIRTEVLVIGAGPAGIAAATAAAANGRKVIVLDDNLAAGGQIWREQTVRKNHLRPHNGSAKQRTLEALSRSGAQVYTGWSVFDAHASGTVEAIQRSGHDEIVDEFGFDRLILATGARERFLPFPGWTLPGIFGAGGLQALVQGGYSVAGKRVIVAGTGPLLMAVATHLAEQGARIGAVVEQAPRAKLARFAASLFTDPAKLMQGARFRATWWNAPYRTGCWVVEAVSGPSQQLQAVRISNGARTWTEPCDLLACGYNLVPNTEIASLLGCAFNGSFVEVDERQRTSLPNIFCAGEPTGIGGVDAALVQGKIAGLSCAGKNTQALQRKAAAGRAFAQRLERTFALREELRSLVQDDTIVCRCEDLPFARLRDRNGWTDAKLQTRCGMGPCQGRVCGPAVEFLLGWKPVSVRPPLFPVPFEALCSHSGAPETENVSSQN